jgi:aryl-phospho-beta-D-glucosidase BglC (GH1 family)
LALLTFALLLPVTISGAQQPDSSLATHRSQHLRHGINLSEWFAQVYDPKGYTKEHFNTWNTAQDVALIKAMDFDHVRLSVNPQPMFRRRQADRIPPGYLSYLDAAVRMILDQGLAVVIDIHPDSDFKHNLATDDGFVEEFADFWRALAQHFSTYDPNLVFFETLNEPEVRDSYRWYGIQARLAVAIIRYGADHWNAQRINAEFDQVAAWAKRWSVPVVCNEFGVYRKVASPHDRANWLSDVRTSLEKHGIGWTMRDYSGGFGIVTKESGQPQLDEITVKALGRTMPPH